MVFSSPVFLFLFLPLVLVVYYNPIFRGRAFRNHVLLLFSLLFYAWGEPLFVLVMMGSIALNWFCVRVMEGYRAPHKRRFWMLVPIVFDVGLIVLFKYLGFFGRSVGQLFGRPLLIDIALPIGISFFTFQIMSYVLDVYRGHAKAQHSVLNLGLYISLFPQLIAGPIVRYETVADQIEHRVETGADFTAGVTRFVFGLGKKVLLADYMGMVADNIFDTVTGLSTATAWLGIVAYALQIYFDFSGYSDMAIGLGKMFGFHFLENFNFPYIARSVTDFWRRWHISLSTWFRDYVYIPLGGNRKGPGRQVLNLFVVWLLTGLWHGANWTFVVWGLYYFVFLALEKRFQVLGRLGPLSHLYTLLVVLVGWVIFRSTSLYKAGEYLGVMFGIGATAPVDAAFTYYLKNGQWVFLAALLCTLPVTRWLRQKLTNAGSPWLAVLDLGRLALTAVVFVLAVLVSVKATYNPFIYFNF